MSKWIPADEQDPPMDGFYMATMDGEIVGDDKPFTGIAEFFHGKWVDDEDDYKCVLAWMMFPAPWRAKK